MEKIGIFVCAVLSCIGGFAIYLLSNRRWTDFVAIAGIQNRTVRRDDVSRNSTESVGPSIFLSETTTLPSAPPPDERSKFVVALPSVGRSEPPQVSSLVGSSVRTITFWSMDSHPGPIQDLRIIFARILKPTFEMKWFEYDFSAMCGLTDSCVNSSKMLATLNRVAVWTGSNRQVARFYRIYRDDPDIQRVDAFVVSMPPSVVRFFIPFSKPIICHFSIPFHGVKLGGWKRTISHLFENASNVVAVNNGLLQRAGSIWLGRKLALVPNLCFYMGARYRGSTLAYSAKKILVMRKPWPPRLYDADKLNKASHEIKAGITFVAYPRGMKWKSLAEDYAAVAFFPYTVSVMVFYESYNVNIPIFLPSMKLAIENEKHHKREVRNFWVRATIAPFKAKTQKEWHAWYSSLDFYNGMYPHLFHFDSIPHLLTLLKAATHDELLTVSKRMAKQTETLYNASMTFWSSVLGNLTRGW